MNDEDPVNSLRTFVELQHRLWDRLRECYPGPLTIGLTSIPKSGTIALDDGEWEFRRHGAGVLFRETDGRRQIDLHDAFAGPDRFDAWRLATYFGGLGRAGERILRRAVGASNATIEKRIDQWLKELASREVLTCQGDSYSFAGPT